MVLASQSLTHALKEWAIAVDALSQGKMIMLLRKGGIRERGFQVKHSPVWLYPTYEHQKPNLLKPEYATQVTPVASGWHPETVTIKSCGEITETILVSSKAQIAALQSYHVWNEQMVGDRLKWQPRMPLAVLLLRVYCLPKPKTIVYDSAYGGCKSWIELKETISSDNLRPVLEDDEFSQQIEQIKTAISLS
ncbi:MAG: DUF1802 family protein [Cyanobacteria bacterium P01_C01_bin.72]